MKVEYDIRVEPDSGMWSAYCDKWGVASCGETEDAAIENTLFAVVAYMTSLAERGLLLSRMKEKGLIRGKK